MRSLNVWIVAPEFAPCATVGGIATGMRGLAEALRRRGHVLTVVVPAMGKEIIGARRIAELELDDAVSPNGFCEVIVSELVEPDGIRVLIVDVPGFDSRHGGYGLDVSPDPRAARRPGLFARAVGYFIQLMNTTERIDIVHAHEWFTAMVPYLLRQAQSKIATIFTIHNLAHQGFFPPAALEHFGLGIEHAAMARLELYGRICLLKGGLVASDRLTTVSPTYAQEIQTPEYGELLDGVLRSRRAELSGIVNGIDTNVWNPGTDIALAARFDARDTSGKNVCKEWLAKELRLNHPQKPLVVSIGRLVEQKGIDLILGGLEAIVNQGANVVIAGAGESQIEREVAQVCGSLSGRAIYAGRVSDDDARRLFAAADLLVMPSRWEPCGLVQLEAMRYGVLPIVRRTGGLADTVIDENDRPAKCNGFVFEELSVDALTSAVFRAMNRLGTEQARAMQYRGMTASLGWEGPATAYEAVYRAALN